MEPQINEPQSVIAPLKKVTRVSKYLAMALFIILPFLGGYIGYTLAPEKVVEVERAVTSVDQGSEVVSDVPVVSDLNPLFQSEVDMGTQVVDDQFISVAPNRYTIPAGYFLEYDTPANDLYSYRARKISDTLTLIQVASPQQPAGPIGTVLYDEISNSVVREVVFPLNTMDVWVNDYTRIVLEWGEDDRNRLRIYDYIANTNEILYEEVEAGVQLAAVCEMGCTGMLRIIENNVVFNRYQRIAGTSAAKFIETVTISIPDTYISKQ